MIKKLSLAALTASALLLTACGGGSDNKSYNPMESKRYIVIFKGVNPWVCESEEFRYELSRRFIGVLTEERTNSINCGDYGRSNNGNTCDIEYYSTYTSNVACVVGVDAVRSYGEVSIVENSTFVDIVKTKLIQISE